MLKKANWLATSADLISSQPAALRQAQGKLAAILLQTGYLFTAGCQLSAACWISSSRQPRSSRSSRRTRYALGALRNAIPWHISCTFNLDEKGACFTMLNFLFQMHSYQG